MTRRFTRLDRLSIRRLQIGERITERGITADRMPDGDIRFSVNIMVDGERIHRVIGRASEGVTRSQSEEFVAKLRTNAKEGRLHLPRRRKTSLTFAKAARVYLDGEGEIGAKDLVLKERHLRLHLIPFFGPMLIHRITTFTVEKFRNEMTRKGHKIAHVNRVLSTYRHMGNRLAARVIILAPLPTPKLTHPENRRRRVLTNNEEIALLNAAANDSHSYSWLFIKIGLCTSLRHSEILSLRFDGLDSMRRRIRARVKGDRWRDQPLSRELSEILVRERDLAEDPTGWIFPSPVSASGRIISMKTAFRRCVIRAGLDPSEVVPHTMRHTAITNLAATGADVCTIQEFSGHRSLAMVMRYTHAQDRRVDNAIDKMEADKTKVEQLAPTGSRDS